MRRWNHDEIDTAAAQLERREGDLYSLEAQIGEQIVLYGEFSQALEGRVFRLVAEHKQGAIRVEKVRHVEKIAR